MADIQKLEKSLGVSFKNKNLLKQALTHRSYINENPALSLSHNERLEFLGDAVLELIVTDYLYRRYKSPEGKLTNWRAALVNRQILADVTSRLGVNDYLFLSKGEAKSKGKSRRIILANTFEAVVGAIYLDQGLEEAARFIKKNVLTLLPEIIKKKLYIDAKSHLQELVQEKVSITPEYKVISEAGPDHAKNFKVGVFVGEKLIGRGEGSSKQEAQERAASDALKDNKWQQLL